VLDAAIEVLGRDPRASMEEIAATAGVSRQTVYAHYRSREILLRAVVELISTQVIAVVEAERLDEGRAIDALGRWARACWGLMERYPLLFNAAIPAAADHDDDYERHRPIIGPLRGLIVRGQRSGDIDGRLPPDWVVAAILALGHASGAEVAGGRMTVTAAGAAFRTAVLRICFPTHSVR
jgi:AcrR family transcriptional regulator